MYISLPVNQTFKLYKITPPPPPPPKKKKKKRTQAFILDQNQVNLMSSTLLLRRTIFLWI